ncbi:hypothetical protein ACQI4L_05860 [Mycolicibacterium litorale]|uniref:hypothetical protein n=1 Tax=Mycolicibacterium litorale TaxID=758802 RepID=UPI003CF982FC
MTAMDGVLVRGRGAPGAVLLACAVLCGCVRVVDGTAAVDGGLDVVLTDVLIEPSRFPAPYRAAVLDPQGTADAVAGVDGIAAAATVEPPECAPPQVGSGPGNAVAAQGVDPDTGAALVVILTRTGATLADRRAQLERCASVTATAGEVPTTVDTVLLPPPPADADDSLASEATIQRSSEPPVRVLRLGAQLEDVRLTAAWLNNDAGVAPDSAALDAVFTDALLSIHRGQR